MKTDKNVRDIIKEGLQTFVEVTVKQHHEVLLEKLPDSSNSGFTRLRSCFECSRHNLKPRHSENECPSENFCFCKSRRRDKRPCPNKICDYIFEGIIENHVKFSPNLKTTDIGQWTQNYWEIAMCYMKHRSESAGSTDLLDLLHLVSNNRFILMKFLPKEASIDSKKDKRVDNMSKIQSIVDKNIKSCRKMKRTHGIFTPDDIKNFCRLFSEINDENAQKAIADLNKIALSLSGNAHKDWQITTDFESSLKDAVSKHFQSAENALRCRVEGSELLHLQLSFAQKLKVYQTAKKLQEERFTDSTIVDVVFGDQHDKKILVKSEVEENRNSAQWSKKEWFTYNVLDLYFNSRNGHITEKEFQKSTSAKGQYSDIVFISKSISNRIGMPLQSFCECVRSDILPKRQHCLVILDFCDEVVRKIFQHDNGVFETHTLLILVRDLYSCLEVYGKSQCVTYVETQPVTELAIRNIGTAFKVRKGQKDSVRIIQQHLYKCVKKIGEQNISTLTLERIAFEENSTKIKVLNIPGLKLFKMKNCALTPVFGSSLQFLLSIEIYTEEKFLSLYLEQIKVMLFPALHSCSGLQHIVTSEIRIGDNSFCLKLNTSAFEKDAKEYFGVKLRDCDKNVTMDLLDIEVAKVLHAANCNYENFIMAEKEVKVHILNSIKYGLLKSDPNFAHVFPAECHQKRKTSMGIVFVCFMKENFDIDKESSWGTYRGFDTFQRSYSLVSPESAIAESSMTKDENIQGGLPEKLKYAAEIITLSSKELMKKHSNLEVIGFSMGKAKENRLDTADGPYIVFYVRLKAFIPFDEEPFPTTLTHPHNPTLSLKTDVREGYYFPLADSHGGVVHPLMKVSQLAMGCSIGFYRNNAAATLGPFVEIESGVAEAKSKEMGFLTVCHLFCLPSEYQRVINGRGKVVQPSFRDERCVDLSSRTRETGIYADTVCGEVVACEYSEEIDAALVRITKRHPRKSLFITCGQGDLSEAGFSEVPEYRDGSTASFTDCFRKNVVKFGKRTELTFGQCRFQGMAIRLIEDTFSATCPMTNRKRSVNMKNLLQIAGFGNSTFCDDGDSGAGLFLVKDDNSLSCVGMVIGKTADGFTVATPIQTILERLSGSPKVLTKLENCRVTMKRFIDQ